MTIGFSYAYTDVEIPSAPFPFAGNNFIALGVPFPVKAVYTPRTRPRPISTMKCRWVK
uniref:Uncharacterized protein n=1 Tax=Phenylobacterium glaciei TaxID=2803784 RepID=A0A974P5J6_9CAUL|nr:hypothetical protein JKL49_05750 [Phenylobacterium glaciei]